MHPSKPHLLAHLHMCLLLSRALELHPLCLQNYHELDIIIPYLQCS